MSRAVNMIKIHANSLKSILRMTARSSRYVQRKDRSM